MADFKPEPELSGRGRGREDVVNDGAVARQRVEEPVVFSFQGAFASPTCGHLNAIFFFAIQMLEKYPDVEIKMLFMPNGAGSKPHVSFTRKSRMDILRAFCVELNAKFAHDHPNITFYACDFEYWLCTSGPFTPDPADIDNPASIKTGQMYGVYTNHAQLTLGEVSGSQGQATVGQGASGDTVHRDAYGIVLKNNDTATFRTLPVLRSAFPNHRIVLGMGLDNMLQLIYWKNLNVYNQFNVVGFYAVNRVLDEKDDKASDMFSIYGSRSSVRLQKVLPWAIEGKVLIERFGPDATIKCEGVVDESTIVAGTTYPGKCEITSRNVSIPIPPLIQLEYKPPPTSSTTLRDIIYKFVQSNNAEDYERIKNIIFGPPRATNISDDVKNVMIDATIEEHKAMYQANPATVSNSGLYDTAITKYQDIIADYKDRYPTIGGKHKKKHTRKRNKHTKKKQRKSNKKRKSNKRR
jgi:hypothetical protein